jgi:poly(hydroxyalkanoate) depolymerase family esterase
MASSLGSLWLKSLKRMTKAPRAEGRKLVKTLVKKTVRTLVSGALPSLTSPSSQPLRRRKKSALVAPPKLVKALKPAGAVWQKSYFVKPDASQMAIPRRMMYWLYLPSGAAARAPLPLVVMLHGCKQTACDIATATRMNALAERKGFAVLYPHQSSGADSHRCWHWYKRSTQRGEGDVALIAQMIAEMQKRYKLDARRTYAAGLSAGAALANILALRHPELIAAVGLHSAPVFGTSDSTLSAYRAMQNGSPHVHEVAVREFLAEQPAFPGMPVMVIHGDRDAVVRRINAEQLEQQFVMLNAAHVSAAEPVTRMYAGRLTGRSPRPAYKIHTWYAKRKPFVVYCEVTGLGHAWSGGDESVDFTEQAGPNASLMLWDFFQHHQRLAAPLVVI